MKERKDGSGDFLEGSHPSWPRVRSWRRALKSENGSGVRYLLIDQKLLGLYSY